MSFALVAISLGLLGSFHCIGMCGPLALALPVHQKSMIGRVLSILVYNSGRVLTYSVFGLLFGLIGKGFFIAGFQQGLSIVIGLAILIAVIFPSGMIFKNKLNSGVFSFFNALKQTLAKLFSNGNGSSLLFIGLLNGLLPCGLVYIAISGAVATGDPFRGMLFMAFFGLGTLPMMLLIPFFGAYMGQAFKTRIRKTIPVFAGLMGVLLIVRGLNLGVPYLSPKIEKSETVVTCHPVKGKKICSGADH